MNKFEIRTQKKKTAVVNAALKLFKEIGFVHVSIKDIAAESGVSSVSLYNYFGSKEGIVKECANVLMQNTLRMAEEIMSQNIDFKEKIVRIMDICAEQDFQLLGSPGAVEDRVLSSLYSENTNQIRIHMLQELIELARKEGVIHSSISLETVLELLNAIGTLQLSWAKSGNYKEKMAEMNRLLLFGLIGNDK
ncbi:TetR/AcrR family transcriptional regulator [Paenibacillus sp. J22TS3]|uniref:TetR/AcrR family transcriptional regulator n=1 Tax=Paenibacillus sp. J22TS3 TaxID=2807192 RepID=UPI001B214EC0|nr:TetR/AcrR family transcriptional regulator [Paenibacillus sp. J22TS3]GIP23175.1 TetR family transcriptional regulator [Paenibacillus sp. J22TS3]